MRLAALFLWVFAPLGLWLAVTVWGTPHVIGSYTYAGSSYLPPSERHYISCTYYGWVGRITVPATHAQCPWLRFFKAKS